MARITISVPKPTPIDNGPLDGMFSQSQAISDAVSQFWKMKLATEADLGKVEETKDGYNVEIKYERTN